MCSAMFQIAQKAGRENPLVPATRKGISAYEYHTASCGLSSNQRDCWRSTREYRQDPVFYGLGTGAVSLGIAILVIAFVAYLTVTYKDRKGQ